MPFVFTHLGMLDHIKAELAPSERDLINNHSNFAYWGSMGPDYLYFYYKDWPNVMGKMSNVILEIQYFLKDIISVGKALNNCFDNTADWISGGLYSNTKHLSDSLNITANAMLEKFILDKRDLFELLRPPIWDHPEATGLPTWWWADIGHHRNTADFARAMWQRSKDDEELRAYCLGYFTHIGVDLVGRPYVNLITGGPYRNHWRRHGFVERILDTHLWHEWTGESVSRSRAFEKITFERPDGIGEELPDNLASMIAGSLQEVYGGYNILSGIPNESDLKHMYKVFFEWFETTSDLSALNLPDPPPFNWLDLPENIRNHLQAVIGKKPSIGTLPIVDPTNAAKWKSFLSSLIRFSVWCLEVVTMICTLPWAVVSHLAAMPAKYILWLALKGVYELYEKVRLALVLAGFMHPEPEQVTRYFQHIVLPPLQDYWEPYPYRHTTNGEQTYHLVHAKELKGAVRESPNSVPIVGTNFPWRTPLDLFIGNPTVSIPL